MISLFDYQIESFRETEAKYNILPWGRRTGKTLGAAKCAILDIAEGHECLWVDTIYSNIDRYFERYFLPELIANELEYDWNAQKKILKIENGFMDMRSADRPESIEGFGYSRIFLNEAGIILNNDSLYVNTILPMLMDFPNSQLFAFGTPKGKINKNGTTHRYWKLWQNVLNEKDNYAGIQLSSHANPKLTQQDIDELAVEMRDFSEDAVSQEIDAVFIDLSDDVVFNHSQFDYFTLHGLNDAHVESTIGAIDVADEGIDALSYPIADIIGSKIYVKEWLFSTQNTNFTLPETAGLTKTNRVNHLVIETNNMGGMFKKEVDKVVPVTTNVLEVYNGSSKSKHTRIIDKAYFIRTYFVFREDYAVDSDYDKAMKQLFSYLKNGTSKKDDAPDSLALLASLALDMFPHLWE